MPRTLTPTVDAALGARQVRAVLLCSLAFDSKSM